MKAKKPKTKKPKAKMGRNTLPIDWKTVDSLAEAGCSGVQIAAYIGVHENTIYARCKKELNLYFVAYLAEKRAKGDSLLQAKQFESAIKDKNISMQIWLGKQRLGQRDKKDIENTINVAKDVHIAIDGKDIDLSNE